MTDTEDDGASSTDSRATQAAGAGSTGAVEPADRTTPIAPRERRELTREEQDFVRRYAEDLPPHHESRWG